MALPLIRLAGTFTYEPAARAATYWLTQLGIPHQFQLAPYNQLFQNLSYGEGELQERDGLSVLLIRLEDWCTPSLDGDGFERVRSNAAELVRLLSENGPVRGQTLVFFCPPTPGREAPSAEQLGELEVSLIRELSNLEAVEVVGSSALLDLYPVRDFYDPLGDAEGHLPYTAEFFTALGTLIARKAYARRVGPHKLLALDCDGTLWSGVCAEDGPAGIRVEPGHAALQRHVLNQRAAGMLVALCSKNLAEDVWAVLDRHPDMALRREHLAGWRIDWNAKSAGLAHLAAELQVGLDRVLFLDDNPLECAEVRRGCPETLVLELPRDAAELSGFLRHVWALDRSATTREDRLRAAHYQQEGARDQARADAGSLAEFFARLELRVRIEPPAEHELERISQLTQRVTQFNSRPAHRTAAEINGWAAAGECLAVHAADRFGDYGLVGAMLLRPDAGSLVVEGLLLSCRALGRGVEHRMLAHLGELAAARGLAAIRFPTAATLRNRPALDFLQAHCREDASGEFVIPASLAVSLEFRPESGAAAATPVSTAPVPGVETRGATEVLARLARIGDDVLALQAEVERSRLRQRPHLESDFASPRTPQEQALAEVAAVVLGIDRIGIHDNLFELGAHSLVLVQISSRIRDLLGVTLPFTRWFQEPTVAAVAAWLEAEESGGMSSADRTADLLALLSEMSDEEAERLLQELEAGIPRGRSVSVAHQVPVVSTRDRTIPEQRGGAGLTIETVAIPTRDRPGLLARCVRSIIANTSQHGRSPELMVFDDSREPDGHLSSYLRDLGSRHPGPIRHYGMRERRELCSALSRDTGAPDEIVQFALFGDPASPSSLGANRNHMFLRTSGRAVFCVDDDIVVQPVSHPEPGDGCGFAFETDPGDCWCFPDAEAEERAARFSRENFLAAHERLLGRRPSDVLADPPSGYPGDPREHRVVLTMNGLLGDCGWGAPFGFWQAPMGYLLLQGASFDRLVASEEAYRTACTSRRLLRIVRREMITDATFSMGGQLGLDNRQPLPPQFPVGRGQDVVHGALLWQCLPEAVFGQVPMALRHLPPEPRRFWPGEVTRTASGMDVARCVIECVRATGLQRSEVLPGQGLQVLGERLRDLGSLPAAGFAHAVLKQARRSNEGWLAVMEARLRQEAGRAPYWEADVRRYVDLMTEASRSSTYWIPLDLAPGQSPETIAHEMQRLIRWFGELLVWWPALAAAAADRERIAAA